jgi:hypothetical protein
MIETVPPLIVRSGHIVDRRNWYLFNKALQLSNHSLKERQSNLEMGYLDLRIDFNKVNSIDNLKKQMEKMIDLQWKNFKQSHGHSTKKETKDLKLIHLVGQLREIDKQSWGQIINHSDFPRQKDPKRRARELYEAYQWLGVAGGWKIYGK